MWFAFVEQILKCCEHLGLCWQVLVYLSCLWRPQEIHIQSSMFLQVDDERVAEELFREQAGSSASQKTDRGGSVDRDDRWGDIYEDMPMKRKIALYDYDPTELSPNVDSEVELSFKTGEIIMIYGDMDDDGFYMGELNARRGLVPSNFLTDIPSGLDPKNGFRQTQPRVLGQQRVPPAGGRW